MPQFPPIPTWYSLHPMIIHFPIVLLLLSPALILVSAIPSPPRGRPYMLIALVFLLLGTGTLLLAAATGEAAARMAERGGDVDAVLQAHQNLARETEIVFSVLCAILLGIVASPRFLRREENRLTATFMPLAFLVLYSAGVLYLVNTAHAGARLVHEFGVHAIIPPENGQSSASSVAPDSAETDLRK